MSERSASKRSRPSDEDVFTFLKDSRSPRILYHYTSMQGFKGIVSKSCIWATDTRYLNDQTELRHAACFTKQEVEKSIAKNSECQKIFERHWKQAGSYRKDGFVASFSKMADDLDQWRGYCPGGLGFNVGMKSQWIKEFALKACKNSEAESDESLAPEVELVPCLYKEEQKVALLREAVNLYANSLVAQEPSNKQEAKFRYLVRYLAICAPLFKNEAFKAEREWRLVISTNSPTFPERCFRVGTSMLIPYIRLNFKHSKAAVVRRVTVGPTPDNELSLQSARGLLRAYGYEAHLEKSRIPYRNL